MNCNFVNISINDRSFIEILEDDNYKEIDIMVYQRLIRKLMYLLYSTRPDIAFIVGQLSKWNIDPRVGYLKVAKQVLRSTKGTIHLGITYETSEVKPMPSKSIEYANSKYVRDCKYRNSAMEYCFLINRIVVF